MRASNDAPGLGRRAPTRGRVAMVAAAVAIFLLATSIRGIAGFYTDYLWYDSLGFSSVWRGILGAKVMLGVIFTSAFFVLMWLNLVIADRMAPPMRQMGPEEELLERYHEMIGHRSGTVRVLVAGMFALIAGAGVSSRWDEWVLFRNRIDFGWTDPQTGADAGFFVFQLPFLTWLLSWLFAAFVIILIVTAVAHYLNGGIRVQGANERVTPAVKGHLSVLLGILAAIKAGDYWLQTYELSLSTRGTVDGAAYTDVKAQLPATKLLILISLFAVGLFIYNIWQRGWVLPVLAVGLWAFVAVVVGTMYPAFIQRFQVEPAESTRELPYIEHNIAATQFAMGLDNVRSESFSADGDLTATDVANNRGTIDNVRLLDPAVVSDTYERLEAQLGFYEFGPDLDVDRYQIDGETTQVVVGARQLNSDGVPQKSWEGQQLVYTHGYGIAVAPANEVDTSGSPNFVVNDVPIKVDDRISVDVDQPHLYYSEDVDGYAIVRTSRKEVDAVDQTFTYDGDGGVGIGNYLRRAAFALRFFEPNPLISGFITSDSRVIYVRNVRERVEKLAPFLEIDADPYPVIHDGRIVYMLDAYTTSDRFPYAQGADTSQVDRRSGLPRRFNYVRNSVKAVVDGYDGTVSLYLMEDAEGNPDPIAAAYAQAFPDLFQTFGDMPDALKDHLRYPEDLFRVQTTMWGRYHIENPLQFYGQIDQWEVAQDVTASATVVQQVTSPTGEVTVTREGKIPPYYQLMKLPGEDDLDFVITRPYVPLSDDDSKKELEAFIVGKSDVDEYGELVVYEIPQAVNGPALVNSQMVSDKEIAAQITLLDQRGSSVELGNLLLVPIEESILWVRPLYVKADGSTAVPELEGVLVANEDDVVLADSVEQALVRLELATATGEVTPAATGEPSTDDLRPLDRSPAAAAALDLTGEETLGELVVMADVAKAEADRLLRDGDLGAYQSKMDEVGAIIDAMREEIEAAPATTDDQPIGDTGEGDDIVGDETVDDTADDDTAGDTTTDDADDAPAPDDDPAAGDEPAEDDDEA